MKREIGPYTVELTGDLITINEKDAGTIWGNTYPIGQVRKQFNEICNRVEQKVWPKKETNEEIS
jgi:hypothetical protein